MNGAPCKISSNYRDSHLFILCQLFCEQLASKFNTRLIKKKKKNLLAGHKSYLVYCIRAIRSDNAILPSYLHKKNLFGF